MTPDFPMRAYEDAVVDFIETLPEGILVIDGHLNIVLANEAAITMFGPLIGDSGNSRNCHHLLYGGSGPCGDCPVQGQGPWPWGKSAVFKSQKGDDIYAKMFLAPWREFFVLSIEDVTREVMMLRQMDLKKKELLAQNVLLRRRRQEAVTEQRQIEKILNRLPDALVAVTDSFTIKRRNQAVSQVFSDASAAKCYELLGHSDPCTSCPAVAGFVPADGSKKSHTIQDRFIMEIISSAPTGDGALLVFRDATRQIQLIEKIRETQDVITRKNQILSNLVLFGALMRTEESPEPVIAFFLDTVLPMVQAQQAVVILNDIREGNIWLSVERGVDAAEVNQITRARLARDTQRGNRPITESAFFPWPGGTSYDLVGANGRRVGMVVLPNRYRGEKDEILRLFIEPMGIDIHNRLLMRQLEEKANIDALTGLYNRGFMDRAFQEEAEKLNRYAIPYAVVAADVNGLKKINDLYGHEAGDLLILMVSGLLKNSIRSTDTVGRVGGDEFILLLSNSTAEDAQQLILRLNDTVFSDARLSVGEAKSFPVTVSLGAAGSDLFIPGTAPQTILKEADRLMYEAKEVFYQSHDRYR
jgi:diguanylate cyclase (GGDEF)-like protein